MSGFVSSVPIPVICLLVALLMFGAIEVGYIVGRRRRRHSDGAAPTSMSPIVGGLLGMLAFVLALTFSMVSSQHLKRKRDVVEEANLISTAFLRADLLDEPYGPETQSILREYVDVRLAGARDASVSEAISEAVTESKRIHGLLWAQVSSAAKAAPDFNTSLMVTATNNVIDMHERRLTDAIRNRIHGSVWTALILISALAMMTMGAQLGYVGRRRLVAVVPLAVAFAVLVTLVVDLDRPSSGMIGIEQQSMIDLRSSMDR